jgi:superfamily II DNA or RNA helicase
MTCRILVDAATVAVEDLDRVLIGRHSSQLAAWGFEFDASSRTHRVALGDGALVSKVTKYLERHGVVVELNPSATETQKAFEASAGEVALARQAGGSFKSAEKAPPELQGFAAYLSGVARTLKDHQVKSALHMLAVGNGANFSVPGSGKTSVVLAAFGWLRKHGILNSLFVVGPPSCFGPWVTEYREVFGTIPQYTVLAGGDIQERLRSYYPSAGTQSDIYLTSFQTLSRDSERAKALLNGPEAKFGLVVDEAHYIKQHQGTWAQAVLEIAPFAKRRWILTGTPFPQSLVDSFNYFEVLWPHHSPLSTQDRVLITTLVHQKSDAEAVALLSQKIDPFIYRVRKSDLGLAPQDLEKPTLVPMNKYERLIYDAVVAKIRDLALGDDYLQFELLTRLRAGRMMRMRQCLSYAKLLSTAVTDYAENLLGDDPKLGDMIRHYDELETPGKITYLRKYVRELRGRREKVLIWSNFVQTLKLLKRLLLEDGHRVELIFGETPTEASGEDIEQTREAIIRDFVKESGGVDILIANPAACAESISLHKACSHAIYYDLSYNCAQYLQSLDRIHRVGGSESKTAHYHFLHYEDTLDGDILDSVRRKAENMSAVIDSDCAVYSLDMFASEDELSAYDRLFARVA